MSKLSNDIHKMLGYLKIIQQYNFFAQLGNEDDIDYLKDKVDNLYYIDDNEQLIKDFEWCANMVNMLYDEVDSDFKKRLLIEENENIDN